jgi:hypothetical protein
MQSNITEILPFSCSISLHPWFVFLQVSCQKDPTQYSFLYVAMAKRPLFPSSLLHFVALLSLLNLFISHLSRSLVLADSHFEGFDSEDADLDTEIDSDADILYTGSLRSPPLTHFDPEPTQTTPPDPISNPTPTPSSRSPPSFEYRDEDELEGLPVMEQTPPETPIITENATSSDPKSKPLPSLKLKPGPRSYTVEIVCGTFLNRSRPEQTEVEPNHAEGNPKK